MTEAKFDEIRKSKSEGREVDHQCESVVVTASLQVASLGRIDLSSLAREESFETTLSGHAS